jgi:kynurenine formamidase
MPNPSSAASSTGGDKTVWPQHTGNWDRWNNDLGTMNLIDRESVLRAAGSIRTGEVYALSWPLADSDGANYFTEPAYEHRMVSVTDSSGFMQDAGDLISARQHGLLNTHLDALGHVGVRGKAFNGHAWDDVADQSRLKMLDVTAHLRIVARGILVDVPRLRGVDSLSAGESVAADEIAGSLVDVQPGDAVIVRLGNQWRFDLDNGDDAELDGNGFKFGLPGLDVSAVDLIASHDACLLGTDCSADVLPAKDPDFRGPIHLLTEAIYGMPLVHNLNLEAISTDCAAQGRNDFFFSVSPVNLPGATGSLVSPIGVL